MVDSPTVILFSTFYRPLQSGAERFAEEVVARLGSRYRFVVVTARLRRALPAQEVIGQAQIVRLGLGTPFDKWLYPPLAAWYAWRSRPALLHAVMESYAGIALLVCAFFLPRVPRLLTLQSGDLDDEDKQKKIPQWLWRAVHRTPDHVTAISQFLADRAIRLRRSDRSISVIPNGVDRLQVPVAHNPVRGRIVCVARLSKEKGHADLLQALAGVRQSIPEAHLVLVGDGPERAALVAQADRLGITSAVTFCGAVSNAQALAEIARAEVFACASQAEGLGIVFIEAQAVGVPVVGTRVGGIPEVIEDGVTGRLVPPHDVPALVQAFQELLTNRDLAARFVATAKIRLERFNWQNIMQNLGERYVYMLEEKRMVIATGIFPPAIGGPATYVAAVAPKLVQAGWAVTVVTYGGPQTVRPVEFATVVVSGRIPTGLRHMWYAGAVWWRLRSADILFLQDPVSAGLPATVANLFLRKKTLLKIVGDHAWEQAQQRAQVVDSLDDFQHRQYSMFVELLRFCEHVVARRAHQVVTPSAYLKKIVTTWGVGADRITVVPNAVHMPDAVVPSPILFGERAMEIVTAGRLVPWKGMRELLSVFLELSQKFSDLRLTCIGDGPLRSVLENDVVTLGISNRVTFTGRLSQTETLQHIARSRLFVLNSGYEGFSHQLIEAMGVGAAVVCTSAGGNAEVAQHEENALVVPYGDRSALLVAITRVLQDSVLATHISHGARITAARYTPERMHAGLRAVLESF